MTRLINYKSEKKERNKKRSGICEVSRSGVECDPAAIRDKR